MRFRRAIFLIILLASFSGFAQFADRLVIDDNTGSVTMSIAADLDGDQDQDIVAISYTVGHFGWYENLDGNGTFGEPNLIAPLSGGRHVISCDIDGDDDLDLVAASFDPDSILWYENTDGLGSFSGGNLVTDQLDLTQQVRAADLDGDNDLDLVSTSRDDDKLAWYENLDGQGNFGPQILISPSTPSTIGVALADLDGDDDIDVVATANGDKRVYWYENLDGLGNFGDAIIVAEVPEFTGYQHVEVADFDGDLDMDILTVEFGGNTIAWHENIDGQGNFGDKNIISDSFLLPRMGYPADLDRDGDMDVLTCSVETPSSIVGWFENTDGLGTFGSLNIISEEVEQSPRSVFGVDLDGDSDNDVLTSSIQQQTVSWYENLHTLGNDDFQSDDLFIHPNPVYDLLLITSPMEVAQAAIYDLGGRLIDEPEVVENQIDVSFLSSGVYLLKVEVEGNIITKKIIKY